MNQFKQYLQNIAPLTDREFADTSSCFTEQNLKKGDFFAKQDQICQHIAFIVEGTLRTYYVNDKAEEITSCFCTANNLTTSYKSFILQQPSALNLQAMEDTQLLIIDYTNLQKLYARSAVWQTIGRAVAEREYMVMEQYASMLNNETVKEKYERLVKEQPDVLQKANLEEIASYLGVTKRTVSRIRQEILKSI